jgi:hypothetical protein
MLVACTGSNECLIEPAVLLRRLQLLLSNTKGNPSRLYTMAAESNTSPCVMQKAFCASNVTVDKVNKILQNCELEKSDTEHSNHESHSDTDRDPEADKNETGHVQVLRYPAKQRVSNENLLLSDTQWNNNTTFISAVHETDAST